MRRRLPLSLGDLFRQPGYHLEEVTDHAEVGDGEDGRLAVLVDGNDRLGGLHPGAVLDRPGDPDRHVELRRDRLADLEMAKMGASPSLLTATIVLEVCIPARCWIAPEIPTAT